MGHETVNGDLTGYTIYDTTTGDGDLFGIYTYIPMQDRINFIYYLHFETGPADNSRAAQTAVVVLLLLLLLLLPIGTQHTRKLLNRLRRRGSFQLFVRILLIDDLTENETFKW